MPGRRNAPGDDGRPAGANECQPPDDPRRRPGGHPDPPSSRWLLISWTWPTSAGPRRFARGRREARPAAPGVYLLLAHVAAPPSLLNDGLAVLREAGRRVDASRTSSRSAFLDVGGMPGGLLARPAGGRGCRASAGRDACEACCRVFSTSSEDDPNPVVASFRPPLGCGSWGRGRPRLRRGSGPRKRTAAAQSVPTEEDWPRRPAGRWLAQPDADYRSSRRWRFLGPEVDPARRRDDAAAVPTLADCLASLTCWLGPPAPLVDGEFMVLDDDLNAAASRGLTAGRRSAPGRITTCWASS